MSINPHSPIVKAYYKLFAHDITRFVFIGGLGFIVNFTVLALLYDFLDLPISFSQIVGAETALLATFLGNNFWAFVGHHHIPIWRKLIKFHATAGVGILINSTFVVLLVKYAHLYYGLALVCGSLAGLSWNYTMNKKVIFKTPKDKIPAD
jgi:putative flippase GtrA